MDQSRLTGEAPRIGQGAGHEVDGASGDKALFILQSLICLLREKNLLTRADIEDLREMVLSRAQNPAASPLPCCSEGAAAAAAEMQDLGDYIGRRYGGKHRRFQ